MMYWTDWGRKPKIESAWMDGQKREVLVSEEDLGWPTGLALDYVNGNRLYWCDSKENIIESMRPDGTDRRIIISGGQKCVSQYRPTLVRFWKLRWLQSNYIIPVSSLFQTLDIHIVWMSLRGMFTGPQKTRVKFGRQISLAKEIKSKFSPLIPGWLKSAFTRSTGTTAQVRTQSMEGRGKGWKYEWLYI